MSLHCTLNSDSKTSVHLADLLKAMAKLTLEGSCSVS